MVDTRASFAEPFSGLAENLKFLTNVPNGSVWREVDTSELYFYNESDKTWYKYNSKVIISDGTNDVDVSEDGQMHVVMQGKVDTANTTMVSLLADAVWEGSAVDVLPYAGIGILVGADVLGSLTVWYSPDNTNWYSGETYSILAGASKFFSPPRQSAYYKLIYTNDSTDQTSFYVHSLLSKTPFKWSSHNIDMPIVDEDDAELVKAVITGKKVNGDYDNVSLTNGANMKVSLEELESGVSSNSNSQLNVTPFESGGGEYKQDLITGAFTTIDYAHSEVHSGDHFFSKDWTDLANGATYDILLVAPNTTKWAHFLFSLSFEAEANVILYGGVTTSSDGTPLFIGNRNGNSATTNGLLAYHTPTITDLGIQLARYKGGSGKQIGGELRSTNEQILTQNTKYLARVHNDTVSNNWIDWLLDWYEHTNR